MRDYKGVPYATLPKPDAKDFQPRLRSWLGDIDYFLRDLSRGVARIQKGEVPDGSGSPLSSGAFVGETPGSVIFVGSDLSLEEDNPHFFWDDANNRLGLGSNAPLALLHLDQVAAVVYARPVSTIGLVQQWHGQDLGTSNLQNYVNEAVLDESTYVTEQGGTGSGTGPLELGLWTAGNVPFTGTPSITVYLRVRRYSGTPAGTEKLKYELFRGSTSVTSQQTAFLGTSFTDVTYALSGAEVASLFNAGADAASIQLSVVGIGDTNTGYEIAQLYLQIGTAATADLTRWHTNSTLVTKVDANSRLGVGAGSATLSAMLTSVAGSASQVTEIVKGFASQSSDLTQWNKSDDTTYLSIDKTGIIKAGPAAASMITMAGVDVLLKATVGGTTIWDFGLGAASGSLTGTSGSITLNSTGGNSGTLTVNNLNGSAASIPVSIKAAGSQSARLLKLLDSAAAELGGFTAAGAMFFVSGAGANKVWTSDGSGIGSWGSLGTIGADFLDTVFRVVDDGDTTKKFALQVSGVSTGTTRTWTVPNASDTFVGLATTDTLSNKTLDTTNRIRCAASITPLLQDTTTPTKQAVFNLSGITAGATRTYTWPNASGALVLTSGAQTLVSKTFTTGDLFSFGTSQTNCILQDETDTSKQAEFDLSAIAASSIRDFAMPDVSAQLVVVGNGATIARVNATNQGAAIGATNLTTSGPAGYYLVHYTLEDTTADVTAGTIQFQINYTDDIGATNQTGAALAMTATGRDRGSFNVWLASGNIQYQTNLVGIIGTAKYALRVRCEFLG